MRVKTVISIAVLALGLSTASEVRGQQVITSVARSGGASDNRAPIGAYNGTTAPLPMQPGGLKDGNYFFSDREFTWTNTPNAMLANKPLIGAEYIRTFNSDKNNRTTVQYAVTTAMKATLFVTVDDRFPDHQAYVNLITDRFASAGTFQDTGIDVFIYESASTPQRQLSIFAAEFAAGTYVFDGPDSGSNNFYVIGAVPSDAAFNPAPVVDAGSDQAIYLGQSAQLAGTVTDKDPEEGEPGVLSWYWRQVSGPGTATFTPSDTTGVLDPAVTFSAKGVYELMLQATDGDKDANDVMLVTVKDRADEFLVGHWDFEDNVEDQSFNDNHGTIVALGGGGTYDPDAAIGAKSINLIDTNPDDVDPNTNYVDLGPAPELDFATGDWTVTAWVKTSQTDTGNIFSKGGDDTPGIRYVLSLGENAPSRLTLTTDDNVSKVQASSSVNINDGRWHFVAGQRAGSEIRVFVDGTLQGTAALPGGYDLSDTSQAHGYIGAGISVNAVDPSQVNDKHFDGLVDDVRVYNYALPLTDEPQYDSILSLTGMGPIVATVNAGADVDFNWRPGREIPLNGLITDLGAPNPMTILWSTESGPEDAEAEFADPVNPVTTVKFPAGGVYILKLTVIDEGVTVEDTVQVTATAPTCADVATDGLLMRMDLNADCYVNLSDLVLLVDNWARCNDPVDTANCSWPW